MSKNTYRWMVEVIPLTKYTFPGREGKYAEYGAKPEWNWKYFDGIDGEDGGLLFSGKEWDDCVPDYLMGADVDYQYPAVREEIKAWGRWIIDEVGFDGFRLDAVKHVDNGFIHEWIDHVQNSSGKDVFFVGEAWIEDSNQLINYINAVDSPHLKVFDFPLHSYFLALANGGGGLNNMSRLAHVGLVNHPDYRDRAVTFADNHDTNRDGEAAGVHRYKYQAYAYLLTREYGIPCVWWKDYYIYGMKTGIDKLLLARKYYAYGPGYEVDNNDLDVYSYVRAGSRNRDWSGPDVDRRSYGRKADCKQTDLCPEAYHHLLRPNRPCKRNVDNGWPRVW